MHSSTVLASLLSISAALALPQPAGLLPRNANKSDLSSNVKLPASGLPAPASGLQLKYVTLGLGTQNYTCKSTPNDASKTPAVNGAVATLYDVSRILSVGSSSIKDEMESIVPPLALSLWDGYKLAPENWPAPMKLKPFGHHFFAGTTPTFVLSGADKPAQIQGKKLANVAAPADACPGIDGEGAVDWLQLGDTGTGFSAGTALAGGQVYRVETAGGAPPASCDGYDGDITVDYSAEYFFYGPSS